MKEKKSDLLKAKIKDLKEQEFSWVNERLEALRKEHSDKKDSEIWKMVIAERNRTFDDKLEELERELRIALLKDELCVGDGVTVCIGTDKDPCTVIKKTKAMLVIQADRATLNPDFHPEFVVGGFCGRCVNQDEQRYTYERDEKGYIYTAHWSEKRLGWFVFGHSRVVLGREKFHDYNF